MVYVCPVCNRGLHRVSETCPGCGLLFDPAQWPEEAYSLKGMRPRLKIVWGNGEVFEPNTDDFSIGRMPDGAGLALGNGVGVSKNHARVSRTGDSWRIEKLGAHELLVDGRSVESAPLENGSIITIGVFLLKVVITYEQNRVTALPEGTLCSPNEIGLEGTRIYIGDDPTRCRILISGADSCHALLYRRDEDQAWWLVDCASTSGVKINNERVRNKKLYPGDEISIAGLDFVFQGDSLTFGHDDSAGIALTFRNAAAEAANGFSILRDLNFSIEPGEFVGVLGPSGCGKSSLIQRIVGLAKFTGGTMEVNGERCSQPFPAAYLDAVAYQPQQNTLHPDLTLREEFAAYRSLHALRGRRISRKDAFDALRLLGLESELRKRTSQLSGGQQRRAGIALALLRKPQLLVLDEPTSGLDPATETEVMAYLKRISNQNKSVICSTHIIENIDLFDKIIVLSRGMLVFCGTPGELLNFFRIDRPTELYRIFASGSCEEQRETARKFAGQYADSSLASKYRQAASSRPLTANGRPDAFKQIYGYWKRMFFELLSFKNGGVWWKTFWTSGCFIQMILQPFLVALVLKMACAYDLVSSDGAKEVLFFASVAVFWLGINNSVRELVRERIPWRCLERLERIFVSSYLAGKLSWATLMCLLQSSIFALFFFGILPQFPLANPNTDPGSELLLTGELFGVLFLVSVTGAWIGLAISAIFKKENAAVGLLPVILIPVLFFSQPIIRNDNYSDGLLASGSGKSGDDSGNYAPVAVAVQRIMPCHAPEVLMDRLNGLRLGNRKVTPEKLREAWCETILILGAYLALSLALMILFQIRNEKEWEGR